MTRLTVLGFRAGRPDAVSPCSGYLLEHDGTTVLVDCGPGIVGQLTARGLEHRIDAVVLTHLHQDHMFDVVPLAFTRLLTPTPPPRIPLYVPEDSVATLARLDDWVAVPTDPAVGRPLSTAFDVRPLVRDGATVVRLGDGVTLTGFRAKHAVPSASLRFALGDRTVAFSSDTGWCDGVLGAARDADVFVCEATYLTADPAMLADHGHLTAELTGSLARTAGVDRLVVSHLLGYDDEKSFAAAAESAAPVPVTAASAGLVVPVG
ncbi:MBL fold metallo-hydrolase [Actinocatenispora rupis]|uniref:MBL fold metallo-hydrolase n=1 Tax=Actinocatenispora rupis TaxID=519421 RepID=A0A8J3NGV3_9ACTN|nr:MBL fold metallo-hydrolase [Actinocatenispora rupis]GID15254.1 MBL fold metallo-hydrolase [Actinocatenispora rupis]